MEGFDRFNRKMKRLKDAFSDLDGEIAQVEFDPHDPLSIEQAIQTLNTAVDQRLIGYSDNNWVTEVANNLKENGRSRILEKAAAARLTDVEV